MRILHVVGACPNFMKAASVLRALSSLTLRENTERPITITMGTNQLVGRDLNKLQSAAKEILQRPAVTNAKLDTTRVPLWDGHAAERIAQIIVRAPVTVR